MPRIDSASTRIRPSIRTSIPQRAWLSLPMGLLGVTLSLAVAAEPTLGESLMQDRDGNTVGAVLLSETPNGVLLHARLGGLPAGVHAFHIHETGACEPPFDSAGGHLTAEEANAHGYLVEDGPHLGDMPNIHIPDNGRLEIEVMTRVSDMDKQLFDRDGAALVIHEGADDYHSQPSGAAGPRIACGVIEKRDT
ncbi:MAG: superoxide dismutase family protein [Chromatiaceae bacterium]|nr:superoxide dismutase family protein [Chromatiaceae bacterium]MCF7996918.1 superoxide dismutase family protein [Chromatiaceae bacterium]MCF8005454.1 superoxide dismutase family protein [Chromatiaceae bacterium]MCF8017631.1 superoxide dismutase family protein [Chromatiaceae bacterium]